MHGEVQMYSMFIFRGEHVSVDLYVGVMWVRGARYLSSPHYSFILQEFVLFKQGRSVNPPPNAPLLPPLPPYTSSNIVTFPCSCLSSITRSVLC